MEVEAITLNKPAFDVRVLKDGTANYNIVKPDSIKTPEEKEEPSAFKLSLKKYEINSQKLNKTFKVLQKWWNFENMVTLDSN